jgi:hypothetical protein
MMNLTLIDATYYAATLLFMVIGILGLSIEYDNAQMTETVRHGDRLEAKADH